MAKKRKASRRRATRRPARRRRSNPDATVNTLVILVVIVMVLGGLFFYAQNKKQSALWPSLTRAFATITAPAPTAAPPPPGINAPEITGSIPAPPPLGGAKSPAAGIDTTPQPTSALDALQAATVAAARIEGN
ncbi:MAG TPA: hypothetical protein VEH78_00005 [Pseudolabrys sp.]|nr:hypothetical protein [Pseudolabrys sp.]